MADEEIVERCLYALVNEGARILEEGIALRASDIDIFDHVNAANSVRFVGSALAVRGLSPSMHRAELKYIGQARVGDTLRVLTSDLGDDCHAADIVRGDEVLFRAVVQTESQ